MDNTEKKKEFLMIFPEVHLAYSPSTLNLFFSLQKHHHIELISAKPAAFFSDHRLTNSDIKYIDFNGKRNVFNILKTVFYKISGLFIKPSNDTLTKRRLYNNKTKTIISYIKQTKKEIIAVDFVALWCAQQAGRKAHLLSLELHQNKEYIENIQLSTIISVIIQSVERLNYLFPKEKPKYFIVQNAPNSIDFVPPYNQRQKTDLIYCGSAVLGFGIITCIDFLRDYKEYTLTVKGALPKETEEVINEFYSDLIIEKRLIINSDYLSETDLTHFVSKFRIGFAFYDFYRFEYLRNFNYYTAPSGKVFQYLNSGVPIIANTLPAFQFIEENGCGKLISHLSSNQIKLAIDAIESNYMTYAEKAKNVSHAYDFDKMVQPFLEFVAESPSIN